MDLILPKRDCKRCGHEWIPRKQEEPETCPKCKSPYWNKPKLTTKQRKEK